MATRIDDRMNPDVFEEFQVSTDFLDRLDLSTFFNEDFTPDELFDAFSDVERFSVASKCAASDIAADEKISASFGDESWRRFAYSERCLAHSDLTAKATSPSCKTNTSDSVLGKSKRKRRKRMSLTGLSRRRREANARERRRVEELNQGYVHLKRALPLPDVDISKLEILKQALKWIDHLATMLENHENEPELLILRQKETFAYADTSARPRNRGCNNVANLENTLWWECIGLEGSSEDEHLGCMHIAKRMSYNIFF